MWLGLGSSEDRPRDGRANHHVYAFAGCSQHPLLCRAQPVDLCFVGLNTTPARPIATGPLLRCPSAVEAILAFCVANQIGSRHGEQSSQHLRAREAGGGG